MKAIAINKDAEIRRETISEDHDCIIVEDFLRDPHELVVFAERHRSEFSAPEKRGYPGLRYRLQATLLADIYRFIRVEMTKYFPFLRGGMDFWTFLSLITQEPGNLSNLQRICHTDPNPDPGRRIYAGLVYLFEDERLGGTSFYHWTDRWQSKDATSIDLDDPDDGLAFLQERFPTFREPPRYMTESNEIAEQLRSFPARFNRMIFYPGDIPHSGALSAPELLSPDVRTGRLTLNIFASALPK